MTDNNARTSDNQQLREKLLEVAEELFGEKGFNSTSIRDITKKTGCNIAAVNYYFGGKENLYSEVFRRRFVKLLEVRLASIEAVMSGKEGEPTLEKLLRGFGRAFLEPLFDEAAGRRLMKLVSREMIDPHLPKGKGFEEIVRPTLAEFTKALKRLVPGLDGEQASICVLLVVGQLVQVIRVRTMRQHMESVELPVFELDKAIEHIVKFSSAGIQAFVKQSSQG